MKSKPFSLVPLETYSPEEYLELFFKFLVEDNYQKQIIRILLKEDENKHYGVDINFLELQEFNHKLGSVLVAHINELIPIFDEAIRKVEESLSREHPRSKEMIFKKNVHSRVGRITRCNEMTRVVMPKASDVGFFVELQGTIIRTGLLKMLEWQRLYECTSCKHQFSVYADIEQRNSFPKIYVCPSKSQRPCKSRSFKYIEGSGICRDYQEIKMQERIGMDGVGSIPRSILVILTDDLVDTCKAGDDVTISGIVRRRWKFAMEGEKPDLEIILEAVSLHVNNQENLGMALTDDTILEFKNHWRRYKENPLYGRNIILRSVCTNLHGLFTVKLATMLALIGGVARYNKNGTKIRGESHLLLVGEPGTGKSQFLKFASLASMRSVLTTGIGSTSAGLTVTAVKEPGGDWALEAGALVLADGGICCIDEFASIKEKDRTTIHEAMEQQTLSIAKAGLVVKLQTRTTVLAATNPKGKYDLEQSISVNTTLASPLLSRFDLVLILVDNQDLEWDKEVSAHILEEQLMDTNMALESGFWNIQKLRAYIAYVKQINPVLTPESKEILVSYYKKQRRSDIQNSARTTVRLLESLIRISQAHARLMFRNKVTVQDAIISVILMEASNHTSALIGVPSTLHSLPPDDPDAEYYEIEGHILNRLGLDVTLSQSQSSNATLATQRVLSTQFRAVQRDNDDNDDLRQSNKKNGLNMSRDGDINANIDDNLIDQSDFCDEDHDQYEIAVRAVQAKRKINEITLSQQHLLQQQQQVSPKKPKLELPETLGYVSDEDPTPTPASQQSSQVIRSTASQRASQVQQQINNLASQYSPLLDNVTNLVPSKNQIKQQNNVVKSNLLSPNDNSSSNRVVNGMSQSNPSQNHQPLQPRDTNASPPAITTVLPAVHNVPTSQNTAPKNNIPTEPPIQTFTNVTRPEDNLKKTTKNKISKVIVQDDKNDDTLSQEGTKGVIIVPTNVQKPKIARVVQEDDDNDNNKQDLNQIQLQQPQHQPNLQIERPRVAPSVGFGEEEELMLDDDEYDYYEKFNTLASNGQSASLLSPASNTAKQQPKVVVQNTPEKSEAQQPDNPFVSSSNGSIVSASPPSVGVASTSVAPSTSTTKKKNKKAFLLD